MHARITTAWIRPGRLEEAARLVREAVRPMARAQPGCQGLLHLADPANGRLLVLTLWDTEAAMEAGETAGYNKTKVATLRPVLRGRPTRETFVVNVCDLAPAGTVDNGVDRD
jgi:quinol monooxygenase YgiN